MKNKYIDLIDQTFEFPQDEFMVEDGELHFHDINMMDIISVNTLKMFIIRSAY